MFVHSSNRAEHFKRPLVDLDLVRIWEIYTLSDASLPAPSLEGINTGWLTTLRQVPGLRMTTLAQIPSTCSFSW